MLLTRHNFFLNKFKTSNRSSINHMNDLNAFEDYKSNGNINYNHYIDYDYYKIDDNNTEDIIF